LSLDLINLILSIFSLTGIVVFSISGALLAAEKKLDILGFILVGAVTSIGGGTLRDVLLGEVPVSWVRDPSSISISILASVLTYFAVHLINRRQVWILWMDAIGLIAFSILGTQAALVHGTPLIIAVVMGVMTATFGGIVRDVLCGVSLTLMRPEMYITCALLASVVYIGLRQFGVVESIAIPCAFFAGFGLRAAAMVYKLVLPRFGA